MSTLAFLGLPDGAGDAVSVVLFLLGFALLFAARSALERV